MRIIYGQAENIYGQAENIYGQAENIYGQAENIWKKGGAISSINTAQSIQGSRTCIQYLLKWGAMGGGEFRSSLEVRYFLKKV